MILFVIPYLVLTTRFNKLLKGPKPPFVLRSITTNDDGFMVTSVNGIYLWEWESIRSVSMNNNYIYILLYNGEFYLIPTHYFLSQNEAVNFFSIINNGLLKVKAKPKTAKRFYNWGWLGLIPNVGFVMGIILIIRGIFQFKNLKLILIGVADILFTICFWWILDNTIFLYPDRDLVSTELNNLVKDIEFYKVEHGTYPDKLYQIKNNYDSPMLQDLFVRRTKEPGQGYFTYYKIGDKYTIFSVGRDRIPNTADDIYPTIQITDSSKIGLIRK